MKINWKVRFKNPLFIAQIVLAIGAPLLAYYGLTAQDLTTWGSVLTLIWNGVSNPYVFGMILISLYNALNDPTVSGLSDSEQALLYERPKKESK
ncbi:phage holin [Sporosarcina sp. USHLN248]|uniref:phage holin n=1 Tax=Sporosarcina sp. USHLN248 TaxID=3081300 RepID=UPI00301AFC2F